MKHIAIITAALGFICIPFNASAEHRIFQTFDAYEGVWITQEPTIPVAGQTAQFQTLFFDCLKSETAINNSQEHMNDRYHGLVDNSFELGAKCSNAALEKGTEQ